MLFTPRRPDKPYFPADDVPFALLVTSGSDQILTFANQVAIQLWGDWLALGQPIRSLDEGARLSNLFDCIEASYRNNENSTDEEICIENRGDAKRIGKYQVSCRPWPQKSGDSISVATFVMDVACYTQKRYEAEEANKAKSSFLAQMSHEIRSPLSAIIEHCEVFRDARDRESQAEQFVSMVERNAHYILSLINEILDLAKVESGKMITAPVAFSIHDLLHQIEADMLVRAMRKGLDFQLDMSPGVPENVISDPKLIRQILHNILSNALKFTAHGSIQLRVDFEDSCVEFILQDTGEGISEERRKVIFDAYEQGHGSAQRFAGTGLGLAITKKIVESLGGSIALRESAPDRGSTFAIKVPVKPVANRTRQIQAKPTASEDSTLLKGARVLVVDDASDNQFIFNNFLSHAGAESESAHNGKEAIDKISHQNFDAVLMDIRMPVMDGIEAMHILRSQGCKLPIIALTAHAMAGQRKRAIEAGFTDYITKPVTREHLVGLLYKCLH